jgi:hypothetical protein
LTGPPDVISLTGFSQPDGRSTGGRAHGTVSKPNNTWLRYMTYTIQQRRDPANGGGDGSRPPAGTQDVFSYTISDGCGSTDTGTVTVIYD